MPNNMNFEKAWARIKGMWSASGHDSTTNISFQNMANITGYQASIPSADPVIVADSNYIFSGSFGGFFENTSTTSYTRIIKNGSTVGEISNTIFIAYAGTYTVTALEGSNEIRKNGTLVTTLSSRGDTTSIASLAVGDQIHGSRPFTCHHTNNPGQQGAYGGYAGYCFATRRDRYTVNIFLQNLSDVRANVEILRTTTSDANVTSMTSVHSVTLDPYSSTANQGNNNGFSTTTTGNYYIISDQLICCWRGQAPSSDTSAMFPLVSDHVYGWYSGNGHTFSVNNAEVGRTNTGGGASIRGRASDNGVDTICSPSSGRRNSYTSDGVSSTLTGGSYFSGDCCVVFDNDALGTTNPSETLFGAESQADGNGGCGTFFTSKPAFGRFTMSGGGAAWNAFVSYGYSGSAPAASGYGDVIMRFNKSDTFQEAKSFTGQNSTSPHLSKAYFGDGSGTGTSATAGDYFICNVAVQGFQDTDASDKDETNMFMYDQMTLPTANAHTLYADSFSSGTPGQVEPWETAAAACDDMTGGGAEGGTVYSPSSTLANGSVLFWDSNFLYPVNGQQLFVGTGAGRSFSEFQLDYNGIIMDEPQAC